MKKTAIKEKEMKKTIEDAKKFFKRRVLQKEDKRKVTKLVEGKKFDYFIMSIILADAAVLGMMTSDFFNLYFNQGLFLLDRLFMGIFIVEMFMRIYGGGKKFFKSGWNVFDFLIVAISSFPFMGAFIILRTFRLFRLLKYVNRLEPMHKVVESFLTLLPVFGGFVGIFAVFFYVFAIIGVSLFGEVFADFENLGSAMFILLQSFTLDGWASEIARPVMEVFPDAWIYFVCLVAVSFLLVSSFLVTAISQMIVLLKK